MILNLVNTDVGFDHSSESEEINLVKIISLQNVERSIQTLEKFKRFEGIIIYFRDDFQ